MRKFYCICLALVLCLWLFACQKPQDQPASDPPPASSKTLHGVITEKIAPDTLVLKVTQFVGDDGETVHVVTDAFDEWCVGDDIYVDYSTEEPAGEASPYRKIIASEIVGEILFAKPIIYLYPETPLECSVRLTLDGRLTCTYPAYGEEGWSGFTAYPDGTLVFPDGKEYYALYWEGAQDLSWDFSQGFCVRGEDTAAFLEWALAEQGLTRREANEFILYWLPLMQENPYNVISFQTTVYTDSAVLDIAPAPDSLLRVFMAYYPTDAAVEMEPQSFEAFAREGFTVVEWGGSRVKAP